MKRRNNMRCMLVLMLMALALFPINVTAEGADTAGNASIGVFNKYIFRGYELSSGSAVIQPSVGISYNGFSASFWGNIDTEENPTQNFVPHRGDERSLNEIDLTLSYTYEIDKLGLTGGYIYYGTKYAAETEELFLALGYDTLLSPALTVYRDITEYPGTYVNMAVSHSLNLVRGISLDLGASAGYFMGDNDYWNTYDRSTGDYTGDEYKALHDGMVKAGLTVPVTEHVSVKPVVQYWFPLSGKAKKTIDGSPYNVNGKLDDTVVAGVTITLSF